MEKVKEIKFRLTLKGSGVVNFDGSDSRFTIMTHSTDSKAQYCNDNIKIAKSTYTRTGKLNGDTNDEIYERRLKISADCLRHAMFENDYDVSNGRIWKNDALSVNFISSPAGLLRGYMFTNENSSLTRKSPITITGAVDNNEAVILPEVGSTSGDKSETSLFYKENVGEVTYSSWGTIDLKQLEFLSCDDFFERRSIRDEWIEGDNALMNAAFASHYGRIPYSIGIFTSAEKTFTKHIGEYGLHFDEAFRKLMVKNALTRLMSINIRRAVSSAYVNGIEIKPAYNAIEDTFENEDGWIKLQSMEDISNVIDSLAFESFYEAADNDAAAVMNECYEKEKEVKKAREEKKKKEAEERRNKRNQNKSTTVEDAQNEEEA